jgi:selenocysteine lyase/cysteine desulfurase
MHAALQVAKEIPGLVVVSPPNGPLASPIVTVGLPPNVTSTAVADLMAEKYKTVVKVTGRMTGEGGPTFPMQATRFTFHLFNTLEDVPTLVANFAATVRELM